MPTLVAQRRHSMRFYSSPPALLRQWLQQVKQGFPSPRWSAKEVVQQVCRRSKPQCRPQAHSGTPIAT